MRNLHQLRHVCDSAAIHVYTYVHMYASICVCCKVLLVIYEIV